MNFSRLKLQEGVATSAGATASIETSQKGKEAASMGAQTAQSAKQMGNERLRRQRAQKADPRGAGQVFENIQRKAEQIKAFESRKSDWRTELNEKVIDGQEREQHPYVTVMPTGDENLINAMKQMGKAVKGKKDDAQGQMKEEVEKKEEDRSDAMPKGDVGHDIHKRSVAAFKKRNPSTKLKNEELELEEAKKKGCKDGYYRDEDGDCVKKKKKSRTTIIVGRGYGYGHGHDHSEDDDSNDTGADGGGEGGGGGDGGGGGMGEMFDILGDMLLQEKEMHFRDAQKAGMTKGNPKKPIDHAKINKQRSMADTKPDTRSDAQKMSDATGPRPGSRYRGD